MHRFWNLIIEPVLTMLRPDIVVEIGSDQGKNTIHLLEFCKDRDAILHAVDPLPKFDVDALKKQYGRHFVFHKSLSLNAIPRIKAADVFLIDGDHNWYTVFNELKLIEKNSTGANKPFPLVILHDIAWPYGRRDLYYNPENIPDKFRKPYKQKGVRPDSAELLEEGGLNQHLNNSIYENDLQSGVLSAIEDFLKETDQSIEFVKLPGLSGLGVLVPKYIKSQHKELAEFLNTFELNPLVNQYFEMIERERGNVEVLLSEKLMLIEEVKLKYQRQLEIEANKLVDKDAVIAGKDAVIAGKDAVIADHIKINEDLKNDLIGLQAYQDNLMEEQDKLLRQIRTLRSMAVNSLRWKLGNAIGKFGRKILFKKHAPTALDELAKVLDRFQSARTKNRDLLPDISYSKKKLHELNSLKSFGFDVNSEQYIPEMPVTVIIPIFNAFEDVKKCLESVLRHTPSSHQVLLINDGSSDQRIGSLLQEYVLNYPAVKLITNTHNLGYPKTVNIGCKACSTDVVLLNSDTLVTPFWIDRILESACRKKEAETFTEALNKNGSFSVLTIDKESKIPAGYTIGSYAELISRLGIRNAPDVIAGSGFCIYIKKDIIDSIVNKNTSQVEIENGAEKEPKTTVLLIHYYFPPRGGAAVQRVVKFCKYLQEFNCRVIVLTSGVEYSLQDFDLLDSIPSDTRIFTTFAPGQRKAMEGQFGKRNMIIDSFLAWVPFAMRKAREIIASHNINVILTTSPPHSQHIIGLRLKKETGLPWVADFRDPWTSDLRFMQYKKGWRGLIDRWMEKRILKNADVVVATTESATESFRQKSPASCDKSKFKCIINGYDSSDYEQNGRASNTEYMKFAYVGSTGPYISNPSFFFHGLKKALEREPGMREKIRVQFIGGLDQENRLLIQTLGLEDVVSFLGFFPHRKAIKLIADSDVLLLFELPVGANNEPTRVIPSKVFEYIGANRPIMAMVIEGDTSDLLKEYELARVIDPRNLDEISDAVIEYFRKFQAGQLWEYTSLPPSKFSRLEQAKYLAEILHELHT